MPYIKIIISIMKKNIYILNYKFVKAQIYLIGPKKHNLKCHVFISIKSTLKYIRKEQGKQA